MDPFPADSRTLALYAQLLSRSFKSTDSIKNYLSGTKTLHAILGFSVKAFRSVELSLTLRGLARLKPHLPHRALPITISILLQIKPWLQLSNPTHATFWALFTTAFFTMSRKSNLVYTPSSKTPLNFIRRAQVSTHAQGLTLHFNWSKTNQFGARVHSVPLLSDPVSPVCPVQALTNMLLLTPGLPKDPLFLLAGKKGFLPVTYYQFQSFLRHMISIIGKNPADYSTHSFRRGGASHAFASFVPSELIKHHGDWSSDCYLLYLNFNFEQRLSVAKSMLQS